MEIKKVSIPVGALIRDYLPVDHTDTSQCQFAHHADLSPAELQVLFWTYSPKWVRRMFKLRNALVKPFGLEVSGDKSQMVECIRTGKPHKIVSRILDTPYENIIKMNDTHLCMHLSIQWIRIDEHTQQVVATTLVEYRNLFGRIYFFVIRPFHNIIVKSMLRHVVSVSITGKELTD